MGSDCVDRFCLRVINGHLRVWRQLGERFRDDVVIPRVQGGGGSVLVWAAIWTGGRSELLHVQVNRTGLVYRNLLDHFVEEYRGDLARRQRASTPCCCCPGIQRELWIQSLPRPVHSLDLNPIELHGII